MTRIIQLQEYSDEELIAMHKKGQSGISELYARYRHLVFGSCLKYFKNKTDAEDAVSEIFVMLDTKLKTHEVQSFKSWLSLIKGSKLKYSKPPAIAVRASRTT